MFPLVDKLLVAVFVPIWGLCFALSVQSAYEQRGSPTLTISTPPDASSYPVLEGFPSHAAATSSLQIGDRLLQLNRTDLRGIGPIGFATLAAQVRGPQRRASLTIERAGRQIETQVEFGSYAKYWPRLPGSVVFAATVVLLLARARPSAMVRAFVYNYMCLALLLSCTFAGAAWETGLAILAQGLSLSLAAPSGVRAALLFPHGRIPSSAWVRVAPWSFALLGPLDVSRFFDTPYPRAVGVFGTGVIAVIITVCIVSIVTRTYWRSNAIDRRKLRWVLFGLYCAVAPPLALTVLSALDPRFTRLLLVSVSTIAFIPMTLVISIARYNLFDIDRLFSTTASYTVVGTALLAILLAGVPALARAVSEPTGVDPSATQLVLSVVTATLLLPAQRRLRPRIDQVFFSERYALEQGFQRLLDELSNCAGPGELVRTAGERVQAMLRAENCVIYARSGDTFAPVFAYGRAIPPVFSARSPLVAALDARAAPLTAERAADQRRLKLLSPFDRAALETLGVPVVVPVRRGGTLVAFLCLGPKQSGDVYTSTELTMLTAMADKVSGELLHFDQADMLQRAQAMQASLRRYVPGAVADQLANGREGDLGERDLTVLFVDLRGYSTLAERRPAGDIFSTVNRYTETVSNIIRTHGGSVVEFSGDGMMAVFGVPNDLPDKERVAVLAARAIVDAVARLPVEPLATSAPLSVGVGITTGAAFVGNVRAVDRLIWTAIGRTVNLAARLQALTRDLDAAIVIDGHTWAAAGPAARDFRIHPGVAIRGHTDPEDVYALPLRSPLGLASRP